MLMALYSPVLGKIIPASRDGGKEIVACGRLPMRINEEKLTVCFAGVVEPEGLGHVSPGQRPG